MIATANENTILIPGGTVLRNLGDGAMYLLGLASDEIGNATDLAEAAQHAELIVAALREEVRVLGDLSASAIRDGAQELARKRSSEREAVAEYLARLEGGGA